jgi:hypothetical protein
VRCWPNQGGREAAGVADIAKLSVGREAYYTPRAGHRPRTVPVRPRGVPRPMVRRRRHQPGLAGGSIAGGGSRPCSRAGTPPQTKLLGRAHGKGAVPAFDMVLRPTKSVSILYSLGDPATSPTHATEQVKGAAEGWVVRQREAACSTVSGKSLARALHGRLWHQCWRIVPQLLTTSD